MANEGFQVRLDTLCADYDRTAAMGMFPHQDVGRPVESNAVRNAMAVAADVTADASDRDQAMWSMVYRQTSDKQTKLHDLLFATATEAKEPVLRRSASWALFKLGNAKLLTQTLRSDDDGNVHSWKQHLI